MTASYLPRGLGEEEPICAGNIIAPANKRGSDLGLPELVNEGHWSNSHQLSGEWDDLTEVQRSGWKRRKPEDPQTAHLH